MNRYLRKLSISAVSLLIAGFVVADASPAVAQGPKAPEWSYAFDLACRKQGQTKFDKDTKKWGFEVFKDANNGLGVYICEIGNIAASSTFGSVAAPLSDAKAPEWKAGLDLKARKAGQLTFDDKTKTYGVEVFFDGNSGNWVYISENGSFSICPGKSADLKELKDPQWLHSFDLKSRKGGVKEWDKATAYGVEIYQDHNNNNLIYITENGSIAVVPTSGPVGKSEGKDPEWLHGQDLQCREVGKPNFNDKTKKFGVEIFRDGNNGNLIFLTETGHISVVTGGKDLKAPTAKPEDAKFQHGLDLSCRQAGKDSFGQETPTYSMEVYEEPNINVTVYLAQTGAISAVRK